MPSIQAPPTVTPALPVRAAFAALAVTSLATAGIHFAVMSEHFDEYFVFGLFFSVVAWLQALWALGIVVAATRRLLVAGLIGNAIVAVVWTISRTIGLPIGPEPGAPEPSAFLDVLSTGLEGGIVLAIAVLLLGRRPPGEARNSRAAVLGVAALTLALMILTTAAVASGGHREGGQGAEEGSGGHETTVDEGLVHVDLGHGRLLQALVDRSGGQAQMRLTFFGANGHELEVDSVSVTGVSRSGDEVDVPVERFEPGHYAATLSLEPGEWAFEVHGVTANGHELVAEFHAEVA